MQIISQPHSSILLAMASHFFSELIPLMFQFIISIFCCDPLETIGRYYLRNKTIPQELLFHRPTIKMSRVI
jgi:hypothetical protein